MEQLPPELQQDFVRQLSALQSQVDGLARPEVTPSGLGALLVKLTNRTGAASEQGRPVMADSANDDAVDIANNDECLGVFLEGGIADGDEAWIVVAGIADVLFADNVGATRGDWVRVGVAGYAQSQAAAPGLLLLHFDEIGHCIETVAAGGAGTHILARCVLHFN